MGELVNGKGGMSQSALGKALNLSPPAITKLKRQGMPTHDVEAAREWRSRNIRQAVTGAPDGPTAPRPGRSPAPAYTDDDPPDYRQARARREQAEAELAELKLAEQRGELARVSEMRSEYSRRIAAARQALLQMPSRVAPLIAADPSPLGIDNALRREIASILEAALSVQ
jgi:phage terminase Nu1 subunit (DNA packaging protein)